MANRIANVSLGREIQLHDNVADDVVPASRLTIMILQSGHEVDDALDDHDTFADILGAANTECDFTNYARIHLTNLELTGSTLDDTNNRRDADLPDQTISNAGGVSSGNNTTGKVVVGYDPLGTNVNANIVQIGHWDYVQTTNGSDLIIQVPNGYLRARR